MDSGSLVMMTCTLATRSLTTLRETDSSREFFFFDR